MFRRRLLMRNRIQELATATIAAVVVMAGGALAQAPADPGQHEFGLSERELAQKIEKVEELIAACMRAQGFEYVAVDYQTVRRAMEADKVLPGLEEKEFIAKFGFGISTLYTGQPPQLATGYSPAKIGLGRRNIEIYKNLSPADQVAYSRALFGDNPSATFAVSLGAENLSRCGGCTRKSIEQVFKPEHMKASYFNPKDANIARDPRMRAALAKYVTQMRAAGFDCENPNFVESYVEERLDAITGGSRVPLEELSPEQLEALAKLQDYERRLAVTNLKLETELIEPIEVLIERELFARQVP
jgi:hypothetical protein